MEAVPRDFCIQVENFQKDGHSANEGRARAKGRSGSRPAGPAGNIADGGSQIVSCSSTSTISAAFYKIDFPGCPNMDFDNISKDVLSFGATLRVRKRQEGLEAVLRRRNRASEALARTRDEVNRKVHKLVETKRSAIDSLRLIRKISRNFEVRPRSVAEGQLGTPPEVQLARVESTIHAADIAANSVQGLTVGTSTALGTWALIGTYGVASTGTAISGLSGAAASNAILAWLGGGSIAAGGGGVAAGTAVLGGIALVPAVLITGALCHLSANQTIKKIDEQEVIALADIRQFTENTTIVQALGRRVEEIDIAIGKARDTFETEFANAYRTLFRYGFLSKLFRHVRHFFGKGFFSNTDLRLISQLIQMAQALAHLIDQKPLDKSGNIL